MPAVPVTVRPLTEADVDTVVRLCRQRERSLGVLRRTSASEVATWWRLTDLASCSWVLSEGSDVVGLGWLTPHGDRAAVDGVVAPGARGRGLGTQLCELSEARAAELALGTVLQHADEADTRARALFESRGYREVRRFYEMAVELDGTQPAPVWPEGVVVRPFGPEDARAYYDASVEAFADEWGFSPHPYDEWLELRVANADTSLYFLAWDGDEIAGIVRGEPRPPSTAFVGLLGVRAPWRRRGLGRALLLHLFRQAFERGDTRVSLGVDAQNPTGATRLYESAGMTVQSVEVAYEAAAPRATAPQSALNRP